MPSPQFKPLRPFGKRRAMLHGGPSLDYNAFYNEWADGAVPQHRAAASEIRMLLFAKPERRRSVIAVGCTKAGERRP